MRTGGGEIVGDVGRSTGSTEFTLSVTGRKRSGKKDGSYEKEVCDPTTYRNRGGLKTSLSGKGTMIYVWDKFNVETGQGV